jgi:uncharacterized protein (TIGR02271 family)
MAQNVVALFDSRNEAQSAENDLIRVGFDEDSIRLVSQDTAGGSTASGAGATDKSLWEEIKDFFRGDSYDDRAEYEEGIRRGGVLLSAAVPEGRATEAVNVLMKHNPVDIDQRAGQWRAAGWAGTASAATSQSSASTTRTTAQTGNAAGASTAGTASRSQSAATTGAAAQGDQAIPVVQEELRVGKRQVQRGVRIYQHVTAKPVEKQVQLRDERVTVERRAVDRPTTAATGDMANAFQEKSYRVTETHEEPVVEKAARVVEEVVVHKDANVRTETVRDQVRRTDVEVQQDAGNTADDARTIYDRDFARSGVAYDQWKPAYEFGCKLGSDQRYRGRDWTTVEPEAKQSFERSLPGRKWDQFRDAVHRAYDRTRQKV